MFRAGVAEMLILSDDHITVTDLPQRTQAEICDFCLGDSKAESTSVGAGGRHGVSLYTKQQFIVMCQNSLKLLTYFLLTYCCFVRPRMTSRFSKALRDGMSFGHC